MGAARSYGIAANEAIHFTRVVGWVAVVALVAAALAGPVASTARGTDHHNPPGNNGTVKVDGEEFDTHPDNEPHVGCRFQIDWYGFDAGVQSHVTFESHPPTGPRRTLLTDTVTLDNDDASGGGSVAGLDGHKTYELDFTGIDPHPNQGYHVKLTIDTQGSQGADEKHKVFWVEACLPRASVSPSTGASVSPSTSASTSPSTGASVSPSTSASVSPGTSASTSPSIPASTPGGSVLPTQGTPALSPTGGVLPTQGTPATSPTGTVLGATGVPTPPPTDTDAPARSADAGWRTALLVLAAILGVALAAAPRPAVRRVRTRD